MIILGVDPGSRMTGYGLILKQGNRSVHIDNGMIHCALAPSFSERLILLFENLQKIIREFNPQIMAIENIFYSKNVQSTVKLGHARGALMVAAAQMKLPIVEYTPLEVKKAIVGFGGASKEQVQKMVKALLNLPQVAEENASDALAVALCASHTLGMQKLVCA